MNDINAAAELIRPFPPSIAESRLQTPAPMFFGHSGPARKVQAMVHRAVRSTLPVLLVGKAGTGKQTIAEILHHFGGGEVPSIDIVHATATTRLGSIGAFTYIDGLENLAIEEQARIPALTGLGRVVLGTTLDPESEQGRRVLHPQIVRWASGVRIDVPSLAERIEDLEQLAMRVVAQSPSRRPIGGISDAALDCLRSYPWPGNVAELTRVIRQAIAAGSTEQIELRDLPASLRVRNVAEVRSHSPERQLCLEEAEKQAIRRALHYARGNKRKAARLLHIGKTTLYRKLKAYDLE